MAFKCLEMAMLFVHKLRLQALMRSRAACLKSKFFNFRPLFLNLHRQPKSRGEVQIHPANRGWRPVKDSPNRFRLTERTIS